MFSILEQYAHFVSVRPCIFNFLRSPEFMQRYTRSVVHDERVWKVKRDRRKSLYDAAQTPTRAASICIHNWKVFGSRKSALFLSICTNFPFKFSERRKLKEWRINVERNYLIRKRSEINAWNAISQHESGGSALNTLVTHDRVASSFEVTFKFIYCYRSIKKKVSVEMTNEHMIFCIN